jgi:hypothetical protein
MNVNILLLPTQTSLARFRSASAVSACDSLHLDILPYQPISKLPNRLELPGTAIQTCRLCLSTLCYAALQSIYALCFVSSSSVSLNFRDTSLHLILARAFLLSDSCLRCFCYRSYTVPACALLDDFSFRIPGLRRHSDPFSSGPLARPECFQFLATGRD